MMPLPPVIDDRLLVIGNWWLALDARPTTKNQKPTTSFPAESSEI
jgi:hypothetical protein